MKLLQRLRDLRNGPDALIDELRYDRLEFSIEADTDAYGIGATMEQDILRYDIKNFKTE